MKRMVFNIGKNILIYILVILGVTALCALLLFPYYNNSYGEILLSLFSNVISINENNKTMVNLILSVRNLIGGIALAILTSYIFANILNREVKIIFPEKIVLRRRTSEGSEGKLTLGILIGNPEKRWLYDVKCSINCIYLKQNGDIVKRNSEIHLSQSVEFIQNYYRFSFDIRELPKVFWKHYIERKEEYVGNDYLIVTIMGKTNGLGGYFRTIKKYNIQDIIVDMHEPEMYFKKKVNNIFTSEEKTKIDWREFPKYMEAGEDDRQSIINEIRMYVNEKEK